MYRYWVIFLGALLLGGCSWFGATQPAPESGMVTPPQVSVSTLTHQPATPLPSTAPATPTPSPRPIATEPRPLPTVTPTLRPIAVSLLPLPGPDQPTTTLPAPQQPITGAPFPIIAPALTLTALLSQTLVAPERLELAPTPDGVLRTQRVPILMYHYLSDPPANADIYRRDLSVRPALFAAQLAQMQAAGYTVISLYDLVAALTQGAALPARPVILTFDDGYRDNYENAFPLLQEYGMKATFFIVTDFIDEQRPEYLTWEMVREMYAAGMAIESHGRNHVRLRGKDKDYLIWQALGSAETIQAELGVRPRFICYPSGEYDRLTMEIFQSAHYWAGLTTVQGATHSSADLFELRRVRVRGTTTPEELLRLLALDW